MSKLTGDKKIIVVLPAYNAAKTLKKTLDDLPMEWVDDIILVDDASDDGTAELAKILGLKTFVHRKNGGYGANQKTCYRQAIKLGADFVIMLHPDGQYDPQDLPKFIAKLKSGYDLVLGSRFLAHGDTKPVIPDKNLYPSIKDLCTELNLTTYRRVAGGIVDEIAKRKGVYRPCLSV